MGMTILEFLLFLASANCIVVALTCINIIQAMRACAYRQVIAASYSSRLVDACFKFAERLRHSGSNKGSAYGSGSMFTECTSDCSL